MKENPLISIITPSYKQGQFIEDAILSVRNQIYSKIEHIIVDGGSQDNTLDILNKHEAKYNMRWLSEPDSGMYHAINKGLKIAKGDILAYLNCDDLYFPWTLSVVVEHLKSADIVFGDVIRCDAGLRDPWLHFFPPFYGTFYHDTGIIAQPTVFFTRRVFDTLGAFDTDRYKYIADCDYWLRAATAGFKPKKINEFLAVQRDYPDTLSAKNISNVMTEFHSLRACYGSANRMKVAVYQILNCFYWRGALFLFQAGVLSWWGKLRRSSFSKLTWMRCLIEMCPKFIRRCFHLKPGFDLSGLLMK